MGFVIEIVNHLRLTWRLFWDERVHWWQRSVFAIPLLYLFIPFRYDLLADLLPLIGLVDDWLLALLCTFVFVAICPRTAVRAIRRAILLSDPDPSVRDRARADVKTLETLSAAERLEMRRHPQEPMALALGLAILVGISVLGGVLVGVPLILFVGFSSLAARMTRARLLSKAVKVDVESFPQVQACVDRCWDHLPYVPVDVFVLSSSHLNAYTFGLDRPYTMVLSSRLVEELGADELAAVIGHELGHVLFEHTFLSSLMGGMLYRAGVAGLVWALVFFRWRRFAELTADRISLLVCGELNTCVRMLLRLTPGMAREVIDVRAVLSQVTSREKSGLRRRWGELLQSHPHLVTRIRALVDFDAEVFAQDVEEWLGTDDAV